MMHVDRSAMSIKHLERVSASCHPDGMLNDKNCVPIQPAVSEHTTKDSEHHVKNGYGQEKINTKRTEHPKAI